MEQQLIFRDNSLFFSRLSNLAPHAPTIGALGGRPDNISNFRTLNDSNKNNLTELNPWFVTGFVDGEGSFSMSIFKSKTAAIGWTIEPCFIITLHKKDIELLNKIQLFFGVGTVSTLGEKIARYRVRSRDGLQVIISHFYKYPLQVWFLIFVISLLCFSTQSISSVVVLVNKHQKFVKCTTKTRFKPNCSF